jgi:thymidylate kinase
MPVRRIAVTGGPGAGKTTIWRTISHRHPERIVGVSEIATAMFQHVFPRVQSLAERECVQRAIFAVQKNVERVHEYRLQKGQVLLCDRGTPDGAGYWPAGHEAFFEAMHTDWQDELARYDAVLFLETAAAGGLSIAEGNAVRTEAAELAIAIDRRLLQVWSRHPRLHVVKHQTEFDDKVALGLAVLTGWLDAL